MLPPLFKIINRCRIAAHVRPVEIGEESDGARVVLYGVAAFQFGNHAPGVEQMPIRPHAIRGARHLKQAVAERPIALI